MMRAVLAFLLTVVPSLPARGQAPAIIHLPHKTIEVVGLARWTVRMIQDSMDRYSPGDSLQSHACAAVLRYKLHFADAATTTFSSGPSDTMEYDFVAVVEPQDSARVRYRAMPLDTLPPLPEWREFVMFIGRSLDALNVAMYVHAAGSARHDTMPTFARRDSARVARVLAFLQSHAGKGDATLARRVLSTNRNVLNRSVAAAVLANFDDDTTISTLVSTLRERDGWAKGFAMQALIDIAARRSRRIDWGIAASDVHAILDGTNLFALDQFMSLLTRAGVDSTLARPLLRDGGRAVLAYAGAEQPVMRASALGFLRTISGRDYGTDLNRWRAWIQSL
jgi:hypothetical protein